MSGSSTLTELALPLSVNLMVLGIGSSFGNR
jgi:hypothetical protein